MLPFRKNQDDVGASAPVQSVSRKPDEDSDSYDAMEAAAEDLISAIHSKSVKAVAEALRSAFELADSEPHLEGPHEE